MRPPCTVVTRRPIDPVPYAVYAQQYGTPDCPVGYEVIVRSDDAVGRTCAKRRTEPTVRTEDWYDEIVRVGTGASAFWIDRYEASMWADPEARRGVGGSETAAYGSTDAFAIPMTFPVNGQWSRPDGLNYPPTVTRLWALSIRNVLPSGRMTWFQAQAACRLSGKRLPTREEWLAAAQGHSDPGRSAGTDAACRTGADSPRATGHATGPGLNCESYWGVEDMVGNMDEWVDEWYAAPPPRWPDSDAGITSLSSDYRGDVVFGVFSGGRTGGHWR